MTISCVIGHCRNTGVLLLCGCLLALPMMAHAWQAAPGTPPAPAPFIYTPPPAVQFQQTLQQQQLRDQLQKSQLQSDLHQAVGAQVLRSQTNDPRGQAQLLQAQQAQRDRDRAAQQDLLNRYQHTNSPPPVRYVQPAPASSGH